MWVIVRPKAEADFSQAYVWYEINVLASVASSWKKRLGVCNPSNNDLRVSAVSVEEISVIAIQSAHGCLNLLPADPGVDNNEKYRKGNRINRVTVSSACACCLSASYEQPGRYQSGR